MKTLPIELQNEISKDFSYLAIGIEIDFISEKKRYVNFDKDVWYLDYFWESRSFEFDNAVITMKNEIDYVSLKIDNTDLFFTTAMRDRDIRKRVVSIYAFSMQSPAKVTAHSVVFRGIIDNIELNDTHMVMKVANPFLLWKTRTPRRLHSPTCSWHFKGLECGYTGSETECDQTWDRCKQLGNEVNFGGFRWLPSLVDKEIWWGRIPKKK